MGAYDDQEWVSTNEVKLCRRSFTRRGLTAAPLFEWENGMDIRMVDISIDSKLLRELAERLGAIITLVGSSPDAVDALERAAHELRAAAQRADNVREMIDSEFLGALGQMIEAVQEPCNCPKCRAERGEPSEDEEGRGRRLDS